MLINPVSVDFSELSDVAKNDLIIWKKKKKNRMKRSCKIFSVDFNPVGTNNILDFQKYLTKRTYKIMFE